jgi:cysteinyl-tRNA synthetase
LLPKDTIFVGLDEHTACIMDLETQTAEIRGLGNIIIQQGSREISFGKGETIPLELFKEGIKQSPKKSNTQTKFNNVKNIENKENSFWDNIHQLETIFREGLEENDSKKMTSALLDLDSTLWKAESTMESAENISQVREILRELIVVLGVEMDSRPGSFESVMNPLVSRLLDLREYYRKEKRWADSDKIRDILYQCKVIVEDTKDGQKWRMINK